MPAAVRCSVLLGRSLRNKSSKDMAFPHPKSRKEHYRNDDKPNTGGVLWNFFKRTINITEYRNAKDDVNRAKNRTFGGIFHDYFVLHLSATPRHLLWPSFELCRQISVYPRQDLLQGRKEPLPPVVGALVGLLLIRPEARLLHAQVGPRARRGESPSDDTFETIGRPRVRHEIVLARTAHFDVAERRAHARFIHLDSRLLSRLRRPVGRFDTELLCVLGVQSPPAAELHRLTTSDAADGSSAEQVIQNIETNVPPGSTH